MSNSREAVGKTASLKNSQFVYNVYDKLEECNCLTLEQAKELFKEMCFNTREYLEPYFDLQGYFQQERM